MPTNHAGLQMIEGQFPLYSGRYGGNCGYGAPGGAFCLIAFILGSVNADFTFTLLGCTTRFGDVLLLGWDLSIHTALPQMWWNLSGLRAKHDLPHEHWL